MPITHPQLIVVSNRLPVHVEAGARGVLVPSNGGLVSAIGGVRDRLQFSWVGWPGERAASAHPDELERDLVRGGYHPVFIDPGELAHFYDGFCNSVLWPLFHYLPNAVDFTLPYWDDYKKVNEQFADVIVPLCGPDTAIWIHDYHLCLLPSLLRARLPEQRIGFFLHIPFPSSEIYRLLPVRRELLEGMLGADLIGFHTHEYCRHFASSCLRVLGATSTPTRIERPGRSCRYGAFPIGIDPRRFADALADDRIAERRERLDRAYAGKKLIVGIDRLDYSKGLPLKLAAFDMFLTQHPEWVGKLHLVQVAMPSRTELAAYQDLKSEVDRAVGTINGKFGRSDYVPIHYIAKDVEFDELCALYERGDACLVTAIRDGMNLVAMEYTVCQRERHGVLVLSEFCGAASTLGSALIVNPRDTQSVADAIGRALAMEPAERERRAIRNYRTVVEFDSVAWARRFVRELTESTYADASHADDLRGAFIHLRRAFASAKRRVFLLDYDGTLSDLAATPEAAAPSADLLALLRALAGGRGTLVHVISGRTQENLEAWFGDLPIGLSAEHGMFARGPGEKQWTKRDDVALDWMDTVTRIVADFTARTPGARTERKRSTVTWHYRQVEPELGEWMSHELLVHLEQTLANLPVSVVVGNLTVEVRPQGVHKGLIARELIERGDSTPLFALCAGDDRTDEDMFAALPPAAWTCRIGESHTLARYYLPTPGDLREILHELVGDERDRR